ncbi:hypothetical protein NliqN6_3840 [Naganishia liquefaciens]|uniref:Cystinosin n=1 Tax=Naganishia liquefaciens TaxID=104408 RepID=A0A8H3TV26_9TREE|nr:hypothetical protein NliqN6_3840 [Naganishia liquefaciens]
MSPWYLQVLGWTYFLAWSISFYPQVILNYKRKTVSGLSQDFSILNPLGFACYASYTLLLTYSPALRSQYAHRNAGHTPQISPADIGFSLHAFFLSSLVLVQTYWYSRPAWARGGRSARALKYQRLADEMMGVDTIGPDVDAWSGKAKPGRRERTTAWTWASLLGISLALLGGLAAVLFYKWEWLDFVYLISYVKLYISIAKWLPQLILNYTRKSTHGFSITVIILDIIGSTTSLLELVISSLLAHDPHGIIGNPVKLGLGLLTMACDGAFVVQRYVLYGAEEEEEEDGKDARRVPDEEEPLL